MNARSQSTFVDAATYATWSPSAASALTVLRATIDACDAAPARPVARHAEITARKMSPRLTRKRLRRANVHSVKSRMLDHARHAVRD